jgi:hypothetical protein
MVWSANVNSRMICAGDYLSKRLDDVSLQFLIGLIGYCFVSVSVRHKMLLCHLHCVILLFAFGDRNATIEITCFGEINQ